MAIRECHKEFDFDVNSTFPRRGVQAPSRKGEVKHAAVLRQTLCCGWKHKSTEMYEEADIN